MFTHTFCVPQLQKKTQFLNNVFRAYEEPIQFPEYEQIWKEIGKEAKHTSQ